MPSKLDLKAWACNTDLRLVKNWHPSGVHRTPWDRHAAPVTALRIRSPPAVSKWTSQLPHRGICSILQGLSRLCICRNAAKNVRTPIPSSRVSPLPHANDSAPAVIHQLSPAIKLGSPLHDGLANAICIAAGKVRAPSPHICVLQHLRIAAMPPLEH